MVGGGESGAGLPVVDDLLGNLPVGSVLDDLPVLGGLLGGR